MNFWPISDKIWNYSTLVLLRAVFIFSSKSFFKCSIELLALIAKTQVSKPSGKVPENEPLKMNRLWLMDQDHKILLGFCMLLLWIRIVLKKKAEIQAWEILLHF